MIKIKNYIGKHRKKPQKTKKSALVVKAAVLAVAVMVAAAGFGVSATAKVDPSKIKTETVYAVLGDDGTYNGATVVNCFTAGGEIIDYGRYTNVANLMGTQAPQISGDKITWPASVTNGHESFYYQGETDKALPVDVDIKYTLNGKPMQPKDIAGKSGELGIAFEIVNKTGTGEFDEKADKEIFTPFAVQVSMTLDGEVFTVLEIPDNGTTMQAGSSITVAYSSFPLPDDTFAFKLHGRDIEMDPINIVVLPKAPPGLDSFGDFVDTDEMSDGTDDMIEGADDMMEGIDELIDGLKEMKDGVAGLDRGLDDLSDGTGDLADGARLLYQSAGTLAGSAGDYYDGMAAFAEGFALFDQGMDALNTGVGDMAVSLSNLSDNTALLNSGVVGMGDGVEGVSQSNAQMNALAAAVAARYPADMDAATLSGGLNMQQAALDALVASGVDLEALSAGVAFGTSSFYTEFSTTFAESVAALRASSSALNTSCVELLEGADGLRYGFSKIKSAIGDLADGTDDLADGAEKASDGIPDLLKAIDDMIEGVTDLRDGVDKLKTDGLTQMKDSLDGLDGYLQKLADEANAYGSFMDTRNNAYSTVQFVLKTNGIEAGEQKKDEPKPAPTDAPVGFADKFVDLF